MEQKEFEAFRNAPAGLQALTLYMSPQYSLDMASAMLNIVDGNLGQTLDSGKAVVSSPQYWLDVALGVVGNGISRSVSRSSVVVKPSSVAAGVGVGDNLVAEAKLGGSANGIVGANSSGLTIASNPATGNPAAIARGMGDLNARQRAVLDQLPEFGSNTIVHKSFGQKDLAALTAQTGDEFAMFSTGGRRLIYRGDAESVPITPQIGADLAAQGWRWSSHVHPGFDVSVLRSSPGDRAVLGAMGGQRSAIFNSTGQQRVFTPAGDSLEGWKPW